MFTGNRAVRIEQLKKGMEWFAKLSTGTTIKVMFDVNIDYIAIK
jgi:hypothetical protein